MKMKSIFSIIFALVLVATSAFAAGYVTLNNDASASKDLTCTVSPATSGLSYIWTKNGQSVNPDDVSESQYVIPASKLTRGDTWRCEAVKDLGYDLGEFSYGYDSAVIVNAAPQFTSAPVLSVVTGSAYVYDSNAVDGDGDVLTYSLTSAPVGMTINPNNGLITWTAGSPGPYGVSISVTDGSATDVQAFTITVTPSAGILPVTAIATPNSGSVPLNVAFSTTIVGGTAPFTYAWDFTNDGTYDSLAATPTHTYSTAGTYTALVLVSDSMGLVGTDTVTITVNPVSGPGAPVFTTTSCPDAKVDEAYTCDINANGNGTVTFSLVSGPSGMTINSTTGIVSWTPSTDGSVSFTVRATAGILSTDKTYTIDVNGNAASQDDLFVDDIVFSVEQFYEGDTLDALVTLENQGNDRFNDLKVTMSIDDLGLEASTAKFDLRDGEKKTEEITLDLPASVAEGNYMVKFVISNDDVRLVRYQQIFIHGSSATAKNVQVVFNPSITASAPVEQKSSINWLGIWFMVLLILILLAVSAYLVRKAREGTQQKEVSIIALDNEQI